MEFLCLFCPAFISVIIYLKDKKDKEINLFKLTSYYFIAVNVINFIILLISKIIFKTYMYLFTVSFSIKYLLLANTLALFYPIVLKYILENKRDIFNKVKRFITKIIIKVKKIKNKKEIVKIIIFIALNIIFFGITDLYIRNITYKITNFYSLSGVHPIIFTITYAILFSGLTLFLPKIIGKIIYIIINIINILLFLVNYFLIKIKGNAFSIYDLSNANEGFEYLNFLSKEITIFLIITILVLIILVIGNFVLLTKISIGKKTKKISLLTVIIIFIISNFVNIKILKNYPAKEWGNINYIGYYYDNFVNNNKSLLVLGAYEYTIRDIQIYIKSITETYGSIEEIEKFIKSSNKTYEENEYTGIFKDKNLIMIQLESIDNIVINNEVMPTLNYMKNNGWNFTGRYTNNTSTFATEYTMLTGLYYLGSDYRTNNNFYNNSLPSIFNDLNYSTQSIHENYGKYYNRTSLHQNIGFNNSYFLYEIHDETKYLYDPQIIDMEDIYNDIIANKEDKFFSYIISISGHGPYTNNNRCNIDLDEGYDETECYDYLSSLTDEMLTKLINNLKRDKLLDDTVIILFSDHYPYSYTFPEDYVETLKSISEKTVIRNIPFIIYSNEIKHKEIDELINDIDILPTILNLFGIKYNPEEYIGTDIFSKNHKNLTILSNYTWYDGIIYNGEYNEEYTTEMIKSDSYVKSILDLNKMIISNNYYAK